MDASLLSPGPAHTLGVPARTPSPLLIGRPKTGSTGHKKRRAPRCRTPIPGFSKGDFRRLARRAGVKRISGLVYEEMRGVMRAFLSKLVEDTVTYTTHRRAMTVNRFDVLYALKFQNRPMYGFGN